MKLSRKILGFALATTLFATQFTMAFATAPADMGNGDGETTDAIGATGNILTNTVDKVVVPTTLKLVLNPNGYDVIMRYLEVTDPDSTTPTTGTTYYTYNTTSKRYFPFTSWGTPATLADARGASGTDGKVYVADATADDQVLSVNYGIFNKSTKDKLIKTDFTVSYTEKTGTDATGTSPIIFVDDAAKTAAYAAGTNDEGAKTNELKMFLQVRSADATDGVKVRQTYKRAVKTDWTATTVFYIYDKDASDNIIGYKLAAGTNASDGFTATNGIFAANTNLEDALRELSGDVFMLTAYAAGGVGVEPETTGAQLSDAVISPSSDATSVRTFVSDTGATAEKAATTKTVYSLPKAKYEKRDGAYIDWQTSQSDVGDSVLYCSQATGVAGFTFYGSMNADCDWSKANTTAIKITPKYTIKDLGTTSVNAIAAAKNQVTLNPSVTFTNVGVITVEDLTAGLTVTSASISYTKDGRSKTDELVGATGVTWSANNTVCTMGTDWTDWLAGAGDVDLTIKLSDNSTLSATATFN